MSDDEPLPSFVLPASQQKNKRRRFRPGAVALREIREYRKGTGLCLRKLPFQKVVREISQKVGPQYRWQSTAVMALQEAAEAWIIGMFEEANFIKHFAKRVTVLPKDLQIAQRVRRDTVALL